MNHEPSTYPTPEQGAAPASAQEQQLANADLLVSRRGFLSGTLRAGAMLGMAGAALEAATLVGCAEDDKIEVLTVSSDNVTTAEELDEMENWSDAMKLVADWDMPYGTIVYSNTPDMAVCLVPTETASPLTHVYTLNPLTGERNRVIRDAQGAEEGFEVYDARGTSHGLIWVEANIFTRIWRVYMGSLNSEGELVNILMVDTGDGEWEMPSVAIVGQYGFWQVRPRLDSTKTMEDSLLKKAAFGSMSNAVAFTSHGRFATPIYPLDTQLVITPRHDNTLKHYELTLLNALTNNVDEIMTLTSGMTPVEAGYGINGFNFSFDAIYDYGDGISNLGTYTPYEQVTNGKYKDRHWFAFVRVPTAPPCWCGDYFVVKSTTAVLGMDLKRARYFVLPVQTGADSYGEYLATTGMSNTMITYTNIDDVPVVGEPRYVCNIRVWQPK